MTKITPVRVLLVEDEPGDANLVKLSLKTTPSVNFEVIWVETLAAAVLALNQSSFDLVLLDLSLPDSKGLETVINTRNAAGDIPIIVLTCSSDRVFSLPALEAGANDYAVKGDCCSGDLARMLNYWFTLMPVTRS